MEDEELKYDQEENPWGGITTKLYWAYKIFKYCLKKI